MDKNPPSKPEIMPPPKVAQAPVAKTSSNVRKTSVTASAVPTSQTNKRRSNAVQEVEKLRDNRDKRRAQQAQVYESQERQKSKDTGTPHWEFLNMIERGVQGGFGHQPPS